MAAWGARLCGQEPESADVLLGRAYGVLTSMPNVEVTVTSRDMVVVTERGPGAVGGADTIRVLNTAYQRVQATYRHPDDWRLVTQRERESATKIVEEKKLVFGKTGSGDGALLLLNVVTEELVRMAIPAALFRQEILERAGLGLRGDPVLSALLFNRSETGASAFRLSGAVRAGDEEVKGVRLVRVVASASGSSRATLWIDESTGLIVRTVVAPSDRTSGIMHLTETLYAYDPLKGADASDFDLDAGWKSAPASFSASAGFVPAGDLAALISTSRTPGANSPRSTPSAPTTPPPPPRIATQGATQVPPSTSASGGATPAPAPATPVVENQLLTPLQMESIVLVEGEEGVGSGFVARIRDVDFVVTNQHVIGGNEKLRITTVRGVPIKVGAIFGAVGRDIAILRIEGENTVPALKIADDPVKTIKLGDKVAVVGNRRGGGVATQVSGLVRGIGPDKIEVDAPFQPGNSGSPIVHVPTGEVIGLATYSLTRKLDALDGPAGANSSKSSDKEAATEQRWFGHRADGIAKWEAVDLVKWRAQAKRVESFASDSEAIYYAMYGRFKEASSNTRVRQLIDRFEERINKFNANQSLANQEVQEFFRSLRALAETGVKDLKTGDYYDFFRTSMYWETSITEQLRAREDIMHRLEKASGNSAAILERLRR